MQPIIDAFAEEPRYVLIAIAIVGLVIVGVIGLFVWSGHAGDRERSRREIAAYVAEGTITPHDAQRILAAGRSKFAAKKT
jgi:hypothetical protein